MPSEITLAVLPFKKKEGEGISFQHFEEDLAHYFSMFQGLSVLSYLSTEHLSINSMEELDRFEVTHLITGSFRIKGDALQLTIQLNEYPSSKIIYTYSDVYETKKWNDILDQTVLKATNILNKQLSEAILSHSYKKPEVQLDTYELFMLGSSHLKEKTPESDQKARFYFEKALEKQPGFARAYSGISSSYFNEWSCQLWDRWELSQLGAKKYALKAIELDESDYISLAILGRVLLFEEEFEQAEFYLRKSLKMNPNDAGNLIQLAFSFMFLGYTDEALQLYDRARKLNPLFEDNYLTVGATLYFEAGDFGKTLEIGSKIDAARTYIDFPVYLAAAAYYQKDEDMALHYWDQFLMKYQTHIYFEGKPGIERALNWHIEVNPYKNESKLKPFWDFIRRRQFDAPIDESKNFSGKYDHHHGSITFNGTQLHCFYQGTSVTIKSTKGLRDLARLLSQPFEEIHCLELTGSKELVSGDVELTDEKSKNEYKRRLIQLQEEIHEAELSHDETKIELLTTEYDQIIDHLSATLGLKGKSRKASTSTDRARAAVTLRIRDSIKKMKAVHPQLARHLDNSIKTGIFCSYTPENPVKWEIKGLSS